MRVLPSLAFLAACTSEPLDAVDLAAAVDVEALVAHLEVFEAVADENDGHRAARTGGYAASVDHLVGTLEAAGYDVAIEPFDVVSFDVVSAEVAVVDGDGPGGIPFEVFTYSGGGTVEAPIVPVDTVLPPGPPNSSTSGCEAADFDGFPAGAIALVQRGSCPFSEKVAHAEAAGAVAVVVFNEGQEGRQGVIQGTLSPQEPTDLPVVGVGFHTGRSLADGATVRIAVEVVREVRQDHNVFVQTAGDPDRVVLLGAHLDSVAAGPGINDNASGSAFLLELAIQLAAVDVPPANTVRFAWWGAEEEGLVGSAAHFFDEFGEPDAEALAGVEAYLNFDMIASGNGSRFVYDGDGSDFRDGVANAGSAEIERLFLSWFAEQDQAVLPEGLLVPTDSYWPALIGVPTGGLFSGASGIKTEEEADRFGGEAGAWRDPCYHQACDRVENTDPLLYGELARAGAAVTWMLATREAPLPAGRVAPRGVDWRTAPRPTGHHGAVSWDR